MNSIILAKELSLNYGQHDIIKRCNLEILNGDFVFITGTSGSGKSTILKSFYGDIKPNNGQLIVAGIDLNNINRYRLNLLRRNIGIVFQDYKLIPEWTIEKNIMLPLTIANYSKYVCQDQAQKLLSHVKLSHQFGRYPLELSGGEQQRVAVARALAHNPIIILADEPTGNLDLYSSKVIWDLLVTANKNLKITIIVVTHNIPDDINVNYKHYSIEDGKLDEIN